MIQVITRSGLVVTSTKRDVLDEAVVVVNHVAGHAVGLRDDVTLVVDHHEVSVASGQRVTRFTVVGEGSVNVLTGGELQRIAIVADADDGDRRFRYRLTVDDHVHLACERVDDLDRVTEVIDLEFEL